MPFGGCCSIVLICRQADLLPVSVMAVLTVLPGFDVVRTRGACQENGPPRLIAAATAFLQRPCQLARCGKHHDGRDEHDDARQAKPLHVEARNPHGERGLVQQQRYHRSDQRRNG